MTTSDRAHELAFRFAQWLWLPLIEAVGAHLYARGRLHATLLPIEERRTVKRGRRRVFSVTRRRA